MTESSASAKAQGKTILQAAWITALVCTAIGALGAVLVRDQMSRSRRDLFSASSVRRLAALGYLAGQPASIDTVLLLRDYIAWEPRPLLRKRAVGTLARMERALTARPLHAGGFG